MTSKPNRSAPRRHRAEAPPARHGLARVLSKRGVCSRSEASALIRAGRVRVDGRTIRDPESPTAPDARIRVDDADAAPVEKVYIALNKPRGCVTTASDERGRRTVYEFLHGAALPWLAAVGRLDKASEGLLLFTNDSAFAARITDPATHIAKTYHVQLDALPDSHLCDRLRAGAVVDGERLAVKAARELRRGARHAWLEIVLDEGRNRHIRRLLAAFGVGVLRLVRVAIGPLALGDLAKGAWRRLDDAELSAISEASEGCRGVRQRTK
ncbi:MAG TPA: pseudouridine synthase [Rudaea sp.]|nr:pseudouridine synthase [Rudaea sp.]